MRRDNKWKYLIIFLIVILIIIGVYFKYFQTKKIIEDFEVDTIFLKVSLIENKDQIRTIKITNNNQAKSFSISSNFFSDKLSLGENHFSLGPNEVKFLEIEFNPGNNSAGAYLDELEIASNGYSKRIPILMEIQSQEIFFDSNINLFPKGDSFVQGETITSEIRIADIANMGEKSVKLNYFIKDFKGNTLVSESEDLIVDKNLEISKSLQLPEDINSGNYLVGVVLIQGASVGTSSAFFVVVDKKIEVLNSDNDLILILLIAIFFFLFVALFTYSIFTRDKLLKELQSQYHRELRRQREFIDAKSKLTYGRLRDSKEKKAYKLEIKRIKKKRIEGIREIYKKRVKKFKKIKLGKNKKQLVNQLKIWKSKGYDTKVIENKFKMPQIRDIRRQVKKWKSKGYDTSVLNKKILKK